MSNSSQLDPHVQAALQRHHIVYRELACDPNLADTAAFCEHYGFEPGQAANTILVATKTDPVHYAATVVLATTKLDVNKRLCQLLETRRASFASADQTTALTGMMIGGVTAFGLPEDLVIYVDSRVLEQPEVVMGGGNRSSKLVLAPTELLKLSQAQAVEALGIMRVNL